MKHCGRFGMMLCMAMLAVSDHGLARSGSEMLDKWNPPPPPPASGLLDDGGLFQRNPSIATAIEERLAVLDERHGFRIHLVVEPVLMTTTPPDLAERLRQAWLPDGHGLVMVYESDTRNLGIGRDLMVVDPAADGPRVSTHVSAAILNRAIAATDKSLPSETYLESLVENLTDDFDDYFQRRAIGPPREQAQRLALVVVAGIAALGLCAVAIGALTRLKSLSGIRTFHFQPVDRSERLGAPAGASVTTRGFQRPH